MTPNRPARIIPRPVLGPAIAPSQRGGIVLYLIIGLVSFGVLAMAGASYMGSAWRGTLAPNCTTASRMMAESGLRFAAARLRAATTAQQLADAITAINNVPFSLGSAGTFTVSIGPDGLGNLQVNATGNGCTGSVPINALASESLNVGNLAAPGEGDIDFSNLVDAFFRTTELAGDPTNSAIRVVGNTISFGRLDQGGNAAAIWYAGNSTGCLNGSCNLNAGMRSYFEVQWDNASQADGLVFGLIGGTVNSLISVGGDTTMGELIGWAGAGPAAMNGYGIRPPKIGLELDTWRNRGGATSYSADSRFDKDFLNTDQWTENRNSDHMAYVFWGGNVALGSVTSGGRTIAHPEVYDDNRHALGSTGGAGSGSDGEPISYQDLDGLGSGRHGYYYKPGVGDWLRSGVKYYIRHELTRFSTTSAASTYCYMLKTWIRDTPMPREYGDTKQDYTVSLPDMTRVFYLNSSMNTGLNKVLFGWTEATGAAKQNIVVSNFYLSFKTTAPTMSIPAGYVAAWPMYNNAGTTVTDIHTSPRNGAITNSVTGPNTNNYWVSGIATPNGSALNCNGTMYVQASDTNKLDLRTAGTASLWFNMDPNNTGASNAGAGLLHKGNAATSSEAYSMQFDANGDLIFLLRQDNTTTRQVKAPVKPTQGRWYHVAATWGVGNNLKLYVNGALVADAGSTLVARNSGGALYMCAIQTTTGPFTGLIDDVYLYNSALTAAQVAALANGAP